MFYRNERNKCPVPIDDGRNPCSAGFVLVEVLVVALIIGILAAVAVPIYTGYIRDQRREVAKNIAESGAAAGNIFFRRTNEDPTPEQLNIFLTDSSKYLIFIDGRYVVVRDISRPEPDTVEAAAAFR